MASRAVVFASRCAPCLQCASVSKQGMASGLDNVNDMHHQVHSSQRGVNNLQKSTEALTQLQVQSSHNTIAGLTPVCTASTATNDGTPATDVSISTTGAVAAALTPAFAGTELTSSSPGWPAQASQSELVVTTPMPSNGIAAAHDAKQVRTDPVSNSVQRHWRRHPFNFPSRVLAVA